MGTEYSEYMAEKIYKVLIHPIKLNLSKIPKKKKTVLYSNTSANVNTEFEFNGYLKAKIY